MRRTRVLVVLSVLLVALFATSLPVFAQVLDYTQQPTYGSIALGSGFSPLPHEATVVAGGSVNVSSMNLGAGCIGYAASPPDFRVTWTQNSSTLLRFYFVPDNGGDTVLIINRPDASWVCNDDSNGTLNPQIDLTPPTSGQYDIWVATYGEGQFMQGTLYVTENTSFSTAAPNGQGGGVVGQMPTLQLSGPITVVTIPPVIQALPTSTPQPPPQVNPQIPQMTLQIAPPVVVTVPPVVPLPGDLTLGFIDPSLDPLFGITTVPNVRPLPHAIDVIVDGTISAESVSPGCPGFYTAAPSFRIANVGITELQIAYSALINGSDATMLVRTPNDQWLCNDDFNGLNPVIQFPQSPAMGYYDVWVGRFSTESVLGGSLTFGQAMPLIENPPQQGSLGDVSNAAGFLPYGNNDEFNTLTPLVNTGFGIVAGAVDLRPQDNPANMGALGALGGQCAGFSAASPTMRVYWSGSSPLLRFFFAAANYYVNQGAQDTTMVVRTPDNQYLCSDDSNGTLNPMVDILNAPTGYYHVWVGRFNETQTIGGTLYMTEAEIPPTALYDFDAIWDGEGGGFGGPGNVAALPTIPPVVTLVPEGLGVAVPGAQLNPALPPIRADLLWNSGVNGDSLIYGDVPFGAADSFNVNGTTGIAPACIGFTTAAPLFRVIFTEPATNLRFYVNGTPMPDGAGGNDPSLIVLAPNGQWYCNGDSFGTPFLMVDVPNPPGGAYMVWVATGTQGDTFAGDFYMVTNSSTPLNPSN